MAVSDTARLIASIELQDKMSKTLDSVNGRLGRLETTTSRVGKGIGFFGATVSTALGVGLQRAVSSGISLVSSSITKAVESSAKLEQIQGQTQAALKSTGNAAGLNATQIRNLALKYEDLNATIDDKVIQSNANLLLSFTNVKGKAFEGTLQAALDLNQALGGGEAGLQGVIVRLGRAMNDPAKGLALLSRSGVSLDDKTKKQILTLQKQNKLFDAQTLLLDALSSRYGGRFAAAGNTATGTVAKLKDSIDDLEISFGTALLPGLQNVQRALATAFRDPGTSKAVADLGKNISDFLSPGNVQKGIGLIKESFSSIKNIAGSIPWGAIGQALKIGGQGAKLILDAFNSAPPWLQTAVVTGWGLNKLSGGLAGSLFGNLAGKGIGAAIDLFKGRGATPATPLFVADVTGGLGGGAPGVVPGGGGLVGNLAKFVLGPAAAIIIGKEIGQTLNAPTINPAKQSEATAFAAAVKSTNLDKLHQDLDAINAQLNTSDTSAQVALIASRIPYIGDALGNVAPELEKQRDALVAAIKAAEFKQASADAVAAGQRRVAADRLSGVSIHTLAAANAARATQSAINATSARTHGYLAKVASVDAATSAHTAAIAKKNFSPTVNVGVNVTSVLNVNAVQRQIVANSLRMTRLGIL